MGTEQEANAIKRIAGVEMMKKRTADDRVYIYSNPISAKKCQQGQFSW